MAVAVLHVMGVRCRARVLVPSAVGLYLVVSSPMEGVGKALLYAAIATLVVATPSLGGRGMVDRLLSSKPVVWLGEISYEIFLLHVLVMAIVFEVVLRWPLFTGSLPVLFLLTLGVTIPLAWLLHGATRVRG
jgi:peptidoglycan/LPS O-acetylase OafA/YrhL